MVDLDKKRVRNRPDSVICCNLMQTKYANIRLCSLKPCTNQDARSSCFSNDFSKRVSRFYISNFLTEIICPKILVEFLGQSPASRQLAFANGCIAVSGPSSE